MSISGRRRGKRFGEHDYEYRIVDRLGLDEVEGNSQKLKGNGDWGGTFYGDFKRGCSPISIPFTASPYGIARKKRTFRAEFKWNEKKRSAQLHANILEQRTVASNPCLFRASYRLVLLKYERLFCFIVRQVSNPANEIGITCTTGGEKK